jgi:lipoprotein-releasing system permease protein
LQTNPNAILKLADLHFPLRVARRYLFSKKSTNAINVITGISALGICVGTAALILVLSVFNGFEDLLTSLYSSFEPEVKLVPAHGKVFTPRENQLDSLAKLDDIAQLAPTLEEVAMFEYKNGQAIGILKGVDEDYARVTDIDSTLLEGRYGTHENNRNLLVVGLGMRNKLSVNIEDYIEPIAVYAVKREKTSDLDQPFRKRFAYPVGTYAIQQRIDEKYIISNLPFAQEVFGYYNGEISAVEIKLRPGAEVAKAIERIKNIMGPEVEVKNRYEQNEAFLKLMNIEKWMGYAVVSLTLLLVAFNMVGSLLMIVIDKRKDIAILKAMGASESVIRNIFLGTGLWLGLLGMAIGFALAILLYVLQKTFGLIQMEGFVVDSYPISMRVGDFLVVSLTVAVIALMASWLPARRAATRIHSSVREG